MDPVILPKSKVIELVHNYDFTYIPDGANCLAFTGSVYIGPEGIKYIQYDYGYEVYDHIKSGLVKAYPPLFGVWRKKQITK